MRSWITKPKARHMLLTDCLADQTLEARVALGAGCGNLRQRESRWTANNCVDMRMQVSELPCKLRDHFYSRKTPQTIMTGSSATFSRVLMQ